MLVAFGATGWGADAGIAAATVAIELLPATNEVRSMIQAALMLYLSHRGAGGRFVDLIINVVFLCFLAAPLSMG